MSDNTVVPRVAHTILLLFVVEYGHLGDAENASGRPTLGHRFQVLLRIIESKSVCIFYMF